MARKVLGILSIVLGAISFVLFWWLSIISIILGIIGLCIKDETETASSNKIMCIIGLIIGCVALLFVIINYIILVNQIGYIFNTTNKIMYLKMEK